MEIEVDLAKSERNLCERGFDFPFAARIFNGRVCAVVDDRRDYGETRMIAVGEIDGKVYPVVYTDRGRVRRIVSAHRASRQETKRWHMSE